MRIALQAEPFDPGRAFVGLHRVDAARRAAVVSFTGLCRAEQGAAEALELEAYAGFTETAIEQDGAGQPCAASASHDVLVLHRVGRIAAGRGHRLRRHRRRATAAPPSRPADRLMDYLKSRAPFWKKSIGPGRRALDRTQRPRTIEDAERWDPPHAPQQRETDSMNAPHHPRRQDRPGASRSPARIAVLTVSDTRDEDSDTSGDVLADRVTADGHRGRRPRHRAATTSSPSASRSTPWIEQRRGPGASSPPAAPA